MEVSWPAGDGNGMDVSPACRCAEGRAWSLTRFSRDANLGTVNTNLRILLIGLAAVMLAIAGCGRATKGQVRFRAGVAAFSSGDYVGAIKLFNEALEAIPDYPGPLIMRGQCYEMLGRDSEALADFTAALESMKRTPLDKDGTIVGEIRHHRGMLYVRMGEYAKALEDFEETLRMDPPGSMVRNSIAWMLATCPDRSLHNPARAIRLAHEEASKDDFTNAAVVDTLAAAYAANGEFDKAVTEQTKVLEIAGDAADEGMRNRLELYQAKKPYIDLVEKSDSQ